MRSRIEYLEIPDVPNMINTVLLLTAHYRVPHAVLNFGSGLSPSSVQDPVVRCASRDTQGNALEIDVAQCCRFFVPSWFCHWAWSERKSSAGHGANEKSQSASGQVQSTLAATN